MFPIVVVELHVATCLDPAHDPGLFLGDRGHPHLRCSPEVRGPVSQNHTGRLVDISGDAVNGGSHFDDGNTFPKTFGFAANALNTAHGHQYESNP